jgi:hypothetical protein
MLGVKVRKLWGSIAAICSRTSFDAGSFRCTMAGGFKANVEPDVDVEPDVIVGTVETLAGAISSVAEGVIMLSTGR